MTKVIVNSVTIKDTDGAPDPNKLISWEYDKDDEEISEAELILPRNISDLVDLSNGQVVEIWGGWSTSTDRRYFYGFIDDLIPEGATVKVLCKNEMILLVRKNINHVYDSSIDASAGEVSEIVEDMIETFGGMTGTVQSSGTADGQRVDQFKCINTDIWERIQTLKKALDWDLYYNDSDRVVYFEPSGYNDSGITLTVGTEIVELPEWDVDTSNMINDLRVDGASVPTELTETGRVGTTSGYTTVSILLTKTPDGVELYMDAADPPTTQKTGGSKDASSGHFYYIDRENKKVLPTTGTTFTNDHYAIINYVWSAEMPVHMKNQASIDSYGLFEKTLEFNDISSVADAESRTASILSRRSIPFTIGKILVKSESANIPNRGETISIVDEKTSTVSGNYLSGDYVVNKIKYMFPSAVEEMEVGDKKWRLADWQQTTEERLKRLEEQFVRNQDILVELVEMQNFTDNENVKKPQSRYFKTITEAYDVSNDRMIWDNTDNGVWDNDKWGDGTDTFESEVVDFIMQYQNSYTEDFIDTDFEDSNGTATGWDSGSVDFTSGQIALSSSIDYNNGTITTATLDSTEVSGSFDYEMAADGSTFESVTPGTAHTFSVTGTDLRFKITENAASTGEISKIIIVTYH